MDPEEIISHSPAPSLLPHLLISLNSNPFLSKFCSGKKLQHIISLLFSLVSVSQHHMLCFIRKLELCNENTSWLWLFWSGSEIQRYSCILCNVSLVIRDPWFSWVVDFSAVQVCIVWILVVSSLNRRIFYLGHRFEICFKQSRGKLN